MKKFLLYLSVAGMVLSTQSCKNDDDSQVIDPTDVAVQNAKENYANIVLANYKDSHAKAAEMKTIIDAFLSNPNEASLNEARQAWYDAREPYGQTEAFRFADGPIDTGDDAVEGMLNAWPLDESFIDYVNYNNESQINIINNPTDYPDINSDVLRSLNELGGNERSVSIGYHAIEFLLWGQDTQTPTNGAEHTTGGDRPYTDFVDGGTASHQDRRRQYLSVATDLLLEDLQYLIDEWDNSGNNYRNEFLSMDNDDALRKMLTGIGVLAGAELAEERILVAVSQSSQEDEHSCFSDNTHRDIQLNFDGVRNVYMGSYTRTDGTTINGVSIHDLLMNQDSAKAEEIVAQFNEIQNNLDATSVPFDYSITQAGDIVKWNAVVEGLRDLGDDFAQTAGILGVGTFEVE